MRNDDFAGSLVVLGLTGSELARRFEVDENTVSAWRVGARSVPGPVARYIEIQLGLKRLLEEVGGIPYSVAESDRGLHLDTSGPLKIGGVCPTCGRMIRKKYASNAERQRAYRERRRSDV